MQGYSILFSTIAALLLLTFSPYFVHAVTSGNSFPPSAIIPTVNETAIKFSQHTQPSDMDISKDGKTAYIVDESGRVLIFNLTSHQVSKAIAVDKGPFVAKLNPFGNKLFVTTNSFLDVIDTASGIVTDRIQLLPLNEKWGLTAITFGAKRVYVGCMCTAGEKSYIWQLDAGTLNITNKIAYPSHKWFQLSSDEKFLYVVNTFAGVLGVIDTSTGKVISEIPGVGKPNATLPDPEFPPGDAVFAAINPKGDRAYVSDQRTNNVAVVDLTTKKVIKTIPVQFPGISSSNIGAIAISQDGKKLFVNNWAANALTVIDVPTLTVAKRVSTEGIHPYSGIKMAPDGKSLIVSNGDSGSITVLDVNSLSR